MEQTRQTGSLMRFDRQAVGRVLGFIGAWAVAALWLTVMPRTAAAEMTPTQAVKGTVDEVIRLLQDKDLQKENRLDERRQKLEKVIAERFDYDEMAKRSLGAQWGKLDEAQRKEFVDLFKAMLSRTYAGKIESYHGEPIQYLNERLKDEYAEVKTKVMHGKAPVPLDYRLMNKSGEWRVYDVVIDGISLVNNYRGQFTKIIHAESYDGLVNRLKQKSDKISAP
jgi:phospholipid transport system substrate-binding protein